MQRTSIKNKLILCFLLLILIVIVVVTTINLLTDKFYVAQALSTAIALGVGVLFGSIFSKSLVGRLNSLSREAEKVSGGDLTRDIPVVSMDEVRSLEEIFGAMVHHIRSMIFDIKKVAFDIKEANLSLVHLLKNFFQALEGLSGITLTGLCFLHGCIDF